MLQSKFSKIKKILSKIPTPFFKPKFSIMVESKLENLSLNEKEQSTFRGVPEQCRYKHVAETSTRDIVRIQSILTFPDRYFDKVVKVAGWARTVRPQANNTLLFIELTDGSCFKNLQVVIEKTLENFEILLKCDVATSFELVGQLVRSPGKNQLIEMNIKDSSVHNAKIHGGCDSGTYPLAKKHHKAETLREIAHLRPRTNLIGAVARVRNNLALSTHLFFQNRGFLYVHTPIITASDCEGAGEMFQVTTVLPAKEKPITEVPVEKGKNTINYQNDFFKKPAFLTVSGQLSVENYCCALSNVYTFGPTFRAENSHTARHLSEFWMIEPEIAFGDIFDVMSLAEDYLKYVLRYVMDNNKDDLEFFDLRVKKGIQEYLKKIVETPFARLTYTEVIDELLKAIQSGVKFDNPVEWGVDLASEHERYIAEKKVKGPVMVYNYPKKIKAFYMRVNEDDKTVAAVDILFPDVGEIMGGSQREERLEVLDKKLTDFNLDPKNYWWYRDLRKYGTIPHSGFGVGFERLIMTATGIENIRDVIPYPRYPGNAEF